MSGVIPDSLAATLEAVEAVCAEFDSHGEFRPAGPGRWICDVGFGWESQIQHVGFVLDTDAPLLAVYVTLGLPGAERHTDSLAKAVARANYGLLPGCFELDLESGETRFRSVLFLPSEEVGTHEVAQLLANALVIAKTYVPAFERIVRSGADPVEAVDEVESD